MDEISVVPEGMNQGAAITLLKERVSSGAKQFMAAMRKALGAETPEAQQAALAEAEVALQAVEPEEPVPPADGVAKGCGECRPGKPCAKHKGMVKEAKSFGLTLSESLRWEYYNALEKAIRSHMEDDALTPAQKAAGIQASMSEFIAAVFPAGIIKGAPVTDEKKVETDEQKPKTDSAAEVQKAIDSALEKERMERAALEKSLKETNEALAKERDIRESRERLDKARALVGKGPAKPEDVAELLKALSPEQQEKLATMLKQAEEATLASRAFTVVGRTGEPASDELIESVRKSAGEAKAAGADPVSAVRAAIKKNAADYRKARSGGE